jgi:hypothetical protein
MNRRSISVAMAASCGAAVLGTVYVQAGFGAVQPSPSPSESPSPGRPVATVTTQDSTETFDTWTWAPPQGTNPPVSAAQASDAAWAEGLPGSYTSETDRLATITDPDMGIDSPTPGWVIAYTGLCVPNFGPNPSPPPDPCDATWYVIVRADTGEVVADTTGSG